MNILLTGGCGFIGSHCAVELLEMGHNVIIIDSLYNSNINVIDKIRLITGKTPIFYNGDICNEDFLNNIFASEKIQTVIHLASFKSVCESVNEPLKYYNNNIRGLLSLLNVMINNNVKNLIFSSSAAVYEPPLTEPLTENSPTNAKSPYANSKLISEQILEDVSKTGKIKVISLRYFNPVGAHKSGLIGDDPTCPNGNLFPIIMDVYNGNKKHLEVFGNDYPTDDGTAIRDYIHISDLANGHIKAIDYFNANFNFEIFNLGTGTGYSVLQIIDKFIKISGKDFPYIISSRRHGDVHTLYTDPTKAKNLLSWSAILTLEDMIKDTLTHNGKSANNFQYVSQVLQ